MHKRKIAARVILAIAIALVPAAVHAASLSGAEPQAIKESALERHPSLEAVQAYASAHNPEIRAARQAWLASRQNVTLDRSYADPSVTYMPDTYNMAETRAGPQTNGFGVSQAIPFPGKLTLKGRIAEQRARAALENLRAVEQEIARRVWTRYADYYYAERALEVNAETTVLARLFESIAQAKYRVGKVSAQDVIEAQEQLSLLAAQRIDFEKARNVALGALNALLDRPARAKIGPPREMGVGQAAATLDALVAEARIARPELKAQDHLVDAREQSVKLAKMGYLPDFSVGGQYIGIGNQGVRGFNKDGHDIWMATLGFSVPIWLDRVKAGVDQAGAQLLEQKYARRNVEDTVADEVQSAYERLRASAARERIYRTTLMPQTAQRIAAAQAGYQAGIVDFLTLIDSLKAYENARLLRYRAVLDYQAAAADLFRAVGRPVAGVVK